MYSLKTTIHKGTLMQNKTILFCSLLLASGTALAEQGLLGSVAEQAAKNAATVVAPDAVNKLDAASQTVENAKALKESVVNVPDALKEQVKDAVQESAKQKLKAVPEEAQKAVGTLKTGKENMSNLEKRVEAAPKTVKKKIKQKAIEKAVDLLR